MKKTPDSFPIGFKQTSFYLMPERLWCVFQSIDTLLELFIGRTFIKADIYPFPGEDVNDHFIGKVK